MRYFVIALLASLSLSGQKLSTRSGYVKFFSDAAVEEIEAVNQQCSSILNLENGQFAFLVPIKGFQFEKALMQEHFNENYMESSKYPNASFKGEIVDYQKIDLKTDQQKKWLFSGTMTIHGVEREITEEVLLNLKDGKLSLESEFGLKVSDYGIDIPSTKKDNISNDLQITVKIKYD